MATDGNIRQISRSRLQAVFKDDDLVRLMESVLYAIRTTNPTAIAAVQAALDAHIADPAAAHAASAISVTPSGGIAAIEVQGALVELDTEKVPNTRTVNGYALSGNVTLSAADVGADPAGTAAASMAAHLAAPDPHPQYLTAAEGNAAYQPLDGDLTTWAAVARASGFDAFVAAPSSVNLKALMTDETGSGALVFAETPTLVSPVLGTPTSGTLTNCTGYPAAALTGGALPAGVTASSLTSVGTLTSITVSGAITVPAAVGAGAAYSVTATDYYVICNDAGTTTITLPSAATPRVLKFLTLQAQPVVSASSNVIPLGGTGTGIAILAATVGKWCEMQADGTNWRIMAAN